MIVDKELIDNVRRLFDLNQYEVSIWIYLISKGVSTAGELSEISNVPRSRAYDVLEGLEKKGFVMIKMDKPIQYLAVTPEEVITRVQKKLLTNAENQVKILEKARNSEVITELTQLYNNGIKNYSPAELSGVIKGRENIYDQIESMIRKAENNIKIVTTEEGIINKLDKLKNSLKKASERGVKINVSTNITDKNKEIIEGLKPYIEFKQSSDINARYCVIDNKQAIMFLLGDEVHPNYDLGIWLNSEAISKVLSKN